jgi:hypothetical protein
MGAFGALVPRGGIGPPTPRFSVIAAASHGVPPCSTDGGMTPNPHHGTRGDGMERVGVAVNVAVRQLARPRRARCRLRFVMLAWRPGVLCYRQMVGRGRSPRGPGSLRPGPPTADCLKGGAAMAESFPLSSPESHLQRTCRCGCGGLPKSPRSEFVSGHFSRVARRGSNGRMVPLLERPLCECGCGQRVATIGSRFAQGHHMRLALPLCACGCGQRVTATRNRFLDGHHGRRSSHPGLSTGGRFMMTSVACSASGTGVPGALIERQELGRGLPATG